MTPEWMIFYTIAIGAIITIVLLEIRRRRVPIEVRHRYCSACGGKMYATTRTHENGEWFSYWICGVPNDLWEASKEGHDLEVVASGRRRPLYNKRTGERLG